MPAHRALYTFRNCLQANPFGSPAASATACFVFGALLVASVVPSRHMSTMAATRQDSVVLYVTTPNTEVAKKLAHGLLEKKLIACANLVPQITSIYTWKDKIEEDNEVLMILKSKQELVDDITAHVRANHPYEVPEVISLPITAGNPAYLDWITQNT
ncbi:CutA1 divalent ion tolerance protein-domain-containing protein, partial [Hyaloraphidium curvatum]